MLIVIQLTQTWGMREYSYAGRPTAKFLQGGIGQRSLGVSRSSNLGQGFYAGGGSGVYGVGSSQFNPTALYESTGRMNQRLSRYGDYQNIYDRNFGYRQSGNQLNSRRNEGFNRGRTASFGYNGLQRHQNLRPIQGRISQSQIQIPSQPRLHPQIQPRPQLHLLLMLVPMLLVVT